MDKHSPVRKCSDDTFFVKGIQFSFEKIGDALCAAPWTFMCLSTIATIFFSLVIPFTEMENNISDFTPYGARSRQELKVYEHFFSDRGEPKVVYAFITPKNGTNLLTVECLNDTIKVLDSISTDFYLETPDGPRNFQQFCTGFCTFNEPVRAFGKGLTLFDGIEGSDHIDLGYPVTTVLGRKLYMDPNFFGVKVAILDDKGVQQAVDVADSVDIINKGDQLPNNIRELNLIILHFRGEMGSEIDRDSLKTYEMGIVNHFAKVFRSDVIDVHILTDHYITSEIVRAGLSLLPFLVVGFSIMTIFSTVTFALSSSAVGQWNIYKIVLAFMACSTPFMACGTSMGMMFLCGFRFGSILCVTPFLVLAIGVDDAYLMSNAWLRICSEKRKMNPNKSDPSLDLRIRIKAMLVETGPSVSITTLTNFIAFGIGALTPTPEIQLFSIGNALAVVIDFIYQLTVYAALMVVIGEKEIAAENETAREIIADKENMADVERTKSIEKKGTKKNARLRVVKRILDVYCKTLTSKTFTVILLGLLGVYWYFSIVGTLNIKSELDPYQLFLKDSTIRKVFDSRRDFVSPNYATCWVLVNKPGDIRNSTDHDRLHTMVKDFESLPPALGPYSTKFFLRDFDDFTGQGGSDTTQLDYTVDEDVEEETEEEEEGQRNTTVTSPQFDEKRDDLAKFMSWPEFSFWKGFLQTKPTENGLLIERFFFTTAYHGREYVEWSRRADLLNMWRRVADKYPDLNITVFEDEAKFLDLIETMVGTTAQSALFTFISMFVVAMMFISDPPTLFVATFSILSTSVGVFGMVSWWGADLDPILMSATVMSIGFSVDIPAHIGYHYFQTGKHHNNVIDRLEHTISAVGFPIVQASVSTILCVLSLFLVDLHMSQIFAKTMFLVVLIGMIHGMVVIPVLLNLMSFVPSRRKPLRASESQQPVVFAVNHNERF